MEKAPNGVCAQKEQGTTAWPCQGMCARNSLDMRSSWYRGCSMAGNSRLCENVYSTVLVIQDTAGLPKTTDYWKKS
jgi:hypothetical protein